MTRFCLDDIGGGRDAQLRLNARISGVKAAPQPAPIPPYDAEIADLMSSMGDIDEILARLQQIDPARLDRFFAQEEEQAQQDAAREEIEEERRATLKEMHRVGKAHYRSLRNKLQWLSLAVRRRKKIDDIRRHTLTAWRQLGRTDRLPIENVVSRGSGAAVLAGAGATYHHLVYAYGISETHAKTLLCQARGGRHQRTVVVDEIDMADLQGALAELLERARRSGARRLANQAAAVLITTCNFAEAHRQDVAPEPAPYETEPGDWRLAGTNAGGTQRP